jgi:hypothetical protein
MENQSWAHRTTTSMAYFTNTCKYTEYQYLTLSNANVILTVQHGTYYHDAMSIRNHDWRKRHISTKHMPIFPCKMLETQTIFDTPREIMSLLMAL